MKQWWQSKTLWLSVLIILGGIFEYVNGLPAGVSVGTIIVGIVNIVIRFLTNQPIAGTPGAKPK